MIVKVQISLVSTDGQKHALVYDKLRKYEYQGVATAEILGAMNGVNKKFFNAYYLKKTKKIRLLQEVKPQNW